ncbi:hypothetical protein [Streptomyces marispadix]|uniref:Integral membrane protein n=1 Tax=Streptomyces marispadix TaxID=2922868 RepID=A0ABS9SV79_9ACTN|nr:hypothetical protein [Streptomyces marispadix]MCH6160189.1 hypothetical protein [Streptomyces marispadix]
MLVALAAVLVPAFILAPGPLAAGMTGGGLDDQRILIDSLSESFVDYWSSGDRDLPPGLERAVDYWQYHHVIKAVIAAILLIVLIALGVLLWRAFLRADGLGSGSRAALASAGAVVTALALCSLVTAEANMQDAIAPFSSLLSQLPFHASHGELADTLDQVRQRLADYPDTGDRTPLALKAMVGDFSRFHAVRVVTATTVAVVLVGMSVASWKRSARAGASERRARRVFRSFGLLSALLSLAVIVVAVANITVTADPAPALLGLFKGGW